MDIKIGKMRLEISKSEGLKQNKYDFTSKNIEFSYFQKTKM